MEPSLENLARATGRPADEVAHLLVCTACTPTFQCDSNPALIRAALAAYRRTGSVTEPATVHVRLDARGRAEVGDVDEFRRIRAQYTDTPLSSLGSAADPRKVQETAKVSA